MDVAIFLLLLVPLATAFEQPEFMKMLIGTENLQIGFGENCYLNWYDKKFWEYDTQFKPTEFRCGTKSGSEIKIEVADNDCYRLKSGDKYMYWERTPKGKVKPMQFRAGGTPDTFWIRKLEEGMFTIIANADHSECPLYWKRGDEDDTEFPAEFRCNKPVADRFWIKVASQTEPPEFIKRLLGTKTLQIGFREDCYLTWYEKRKIRLNRHEKSTEFRCATRSGSEIEIVPAGNEGYLLKSGTKYMYWEGQNGDVKPMQFREATPEKKGDTFWIRKLKDGMFAIGFGFGSSECPLFRRKRKKDDTKFHAEFRCREPVKDTFWIKGDDCKAKIIEPIDNENKATYDGEEIVGHATSGTCSTTNYQTLILGHTDEVTEEISIEVSKSKETNWETSASIAFTAEAGFLGTGVETTLSVGFSKGGSKTYGSSETKSTGLSNAKSSGSETHYNTPGAAMVIGYVRRFIFDHSEVPAKVTAECKNGHQYTFNTTIRLRSKVFGSTSYSTEAVKFKTGQCKEEYLECVRAINFSSYLSITGAKEEFLECFPAESREPQKKKKKIGKGKKEKSSSKSENKDSSQ